LKLSKFPKDLFPISWLKKNNLIKLETKEHKEYFVWSNHTLTEYLVAEYLLEKKNFLDEFDIHACLSKDTISKTIINLVNKNFINKIPILKNMFDLCLKCFNRNKKVSKKRRQEEINQNLKIIGQYWGSQDSQKIIYAKPDKTDSPVKLYPERIGNKICSHQRKVVLGCEFIEPPAPGDRK
jgi:hypothetical protein